MRIRFLGRSTAGGQSPTLYATDRDSYVVQGWIVADPGILAMLDLRHGEAVVEIYARLLSYLAEDGLSGEVKRLVPPIVFVRENGNYIVKGRRVTDADVLGQMKMPEHESCIEVPRDSMALLC